MQALVYSNYQPFIDNNPSRDFNLVGRDFLNKKYYYRLNDPLSSTTERLSKLAIALFATIATLGLALLSSRIRSKWREALSNKKEIIIILKKPLKVNIFPKHADQSNFKSFIDSLELRKFICHNGQCLYIYKKSLQVLPSSISHFKDIEVILIYENLLRELPNEIGQLTQLKELNLLFNQLQTLPSQIGNLNNLERLGVACNQLQDLPQEIQQLTKLKDFDFFCNQIQILPSWIGCLQDLEHLRFSSNQIQELPNEFGKLIKLKKLFLENNQLQRLPLSFTNLQNLEELDLSGNQIRELPDDIGRLTKLDILKLSSNRLQTLPSSIGNLRVIKILHIGGNEIREVPNEIRHLINLIFLDLSYNQISSIPDWLYQLPSCCEINLEGNPLNQEVMAQIQIRTQQPNYRGPRFILSVHEEHRREPTQQLHVLLNEWCDETCKQKILERLTSESNQNLANWLERIKETAGYKNQATVVKAQVKDFLIWLSAESNEENILPVYQILQDATTTCGDRIALSINTLCLHIKICRSNHLNLQELKDLIIGLERYERLQNIARRKCTQLRAVYPIEVHLCYEIHLREALGLPVEQKQMLYERISGVTATDIEEAKKEILDSTSSLNQQIDLLLKHPFWQSRIKIHPNYEAIEKDCTRQKDEVAEQLLGDYAAAEECKEKIQTIWNPNYVITKQILDRS